MNVIAVDLGPLPDPFEVLSHPRRLRLVSPPRTTEPNMPGIAAGIDEVLFKQRATDRLLEEHTETLERIDSQGRQNAADIKVLKRESDAQRQRLDDTVDRMIEVERKLPGRFAGAESIPPIGAIGRPSPSGTHFEIDAEDYTRALAPLAAQLDETKDLVVELRRERDTEIARAEGAERARKELAATAERDRLLAASQSDRLRGWLGFVASLLALLVTATGVYFAVRK